MQGKIYPGEGMTSDCLIVMEWEAELWGTVRLMNTVTHLREVAKTDPLPPLHAMQLGGFTWHHSILGARRLLTVKTTTHENAQGHHLVIKGKNTHFIWMPSPTTLHCGLCFRL